MNLNYYALVAGCGYNDDFCQTVVMSEEAGSAECQVVNLYPEFSYETFEGFGGAITEAAGYIYSLMTQEQKKQVIHTYFSEEEMNYHLVRIHMDSCDFCLDMYEALSDPQDTELTGFSFERTEKYILPMLKDAAAKRNGDLQIMLSPWSPPAFMKTNGQRKQGGKLKPEYRGMWAKYICRYILEFQKRGFTVQRISLQNEANAIQTWDSCLYTAEDEKIFLRDYLYPELVRQGMERIEVFIWDHNKERIFERVRDTVDETTKDMITGAAFHWYSGDHFEALALVKRFYPDMKLIMSESSLEYRLFNKENIDNSGVKLCHEMIGDLNHGMQAFYDWNLLLDEKGGPNHVGNFCHAAFMYDTQTGELKPQKTMQYFYQMSHYIKPNSVRIATTSFTEQIDVAAYRTPEGTITAAVINKSGTMLPVVFRMQGKGAMVLLPAKTLGICVIDRNE